jgi:hypothetical protein
VKNTTHRRATTSISSFDGFAPTRARVATVHPKPSRPLSWNPASLISSQFADSNSTTAEGNQYSVNGIGLAPRYVLEVDGNEGGHHSSGRNSHYDYVIPGYRHSQPTSAPGLDVAAVQADDSSAHWQGTPFGASSAPIANSLGLQDIYQHGAESRPYRDVNVQSGSAYSDYQNRSLESTPPGLQPFFLPYQHTTNDTPHYLGLPNDSPDSTTSDSSNLPPTPIHSAYSTCPHPQQSNYSNCGTTPLTTHSYWNQLQQAPRSDSGICGMDQPVQQLHYGPSSYFSNFSNAGQSVESGENSDAYYPEVYSHDSDYHTPTSCAPYHSNTDDSGFAKIINRYPGYSLPPHSASNHSFSNVLGGFGTSEYVANSEFDDSLTLDKNVGNAEG